MSLPRRVLDQKDLARPDDAGFAVARGDLHARIEVYDVLAARRRVPVEVVLGSGLTEDDPGSRQALRELAATPLLDPLDLDVAKMRLAFGVGVQIVYAHVFSFESLIREW